MQLSTLLLSLKKQNKIIMNTYILTKTTFSAVPAFKVLGSYTNFDLARLAELKQLENLSENETVKITEVEHNDSEDAHAEREGVEVFIYDEYDNRHYIEVKTSLGEITEGPVVIGQDYEVDSIEIYGTDLSKSKLSRQLKRKLDHEADEVKEYLNNQL